MKPDQPQHDRAVTCVIAQQYPSVTFVSFRLIPANKGSGRV
jgi:hypothetical protein